VSPTAGQEPNQFALSNAYPNPFNPSTRIEYTIPHNSFVTLKVYNVLGQEVATLFSGVQQAGKHVAIFDAGTHASGVYMYRLDAENYSATRKLVLLK
jgi:hypothetical protein